MAIITAKKALKGKIGNVYQREFRGKQILQSIPVRSKQDKKKNVNAKLMKFASHHGSLLRKYIEVHLGNRHESFMHSRFLGKLMNAIHSHKDLPVKEKTIFKVDCDALLGFEFNTKALFKDTFLPNIEVRKLSETSIEVTIPAFVPREEVVFPKECTDAIVRFCVFTLENDYQIYQVKSKDRERFQGYIEFNVNESLVEKTVFVFEIPDLKEKVEVIVADIQFYYAVMYMPLRLSLYNNKEYNPSALVYAK